jgi:hypothetical protein
VIDGMSLPKTLISAKTMTELSYLVSDLRINDPKRRIGIIGFGIFGRLNMIKVREVNLPLHLQQKWLQRRIH